MKDLVEYIVKSIVQNPDKVDVKEVSSEGFTSIKVSADEQDLGLIIGKKGKIIKALQSLTQIKGFKENQRYFIKVESALERERVLPATPS